MAIIDPFVNPDIDLTQVKDPTAAKEAARAFEIQKRRMSGTTSLQDLKTAPIIPRRGLDRVMGLGEPVLDVDVAEADPFARIARGYEKGLRTMASTNQFMVAAANSVLGREEARDDAIAKAVGMRHEAKYIDGALDMAQEWEQFADAPTFKGFMRGFTSSIGEVGPTAVASITAALTGTAIAALTAPATVPIAAGAVLTGAGVKGLVRKTVMDGFAKQEIKKAIQRTVKRKKLSEAQEEIMEAVYKNYQKQMYQRRLTRGGLGGAFAQEQTQGTGVFFGNYADQGMIDPISALKSYGLSIPFAGIGVGSEALVFNTVLKNLNKYSFKSGLTKAGRENLQKGAPSVTGTALKVGGVTSLAEGGAELGQQGLEIMQRFNIDPSYTKERARLDAYISFMAGASAGFGFGGGAGVVTGAANKAQHALDSFHQKKLINQMYVNKFGDPDNQVLPEPSQWYLDQFESMFSDNDIEAVWVPIESTEAYESILPKLKEKYDFTKLYQYDMNFEEAGLGGIMISTNPNIIEAFANTMENTVPSTKLLEQQLARFLKYPRRRDPSDTHVIQVRNKKTKGLAHYFQTTAPEEDGTHPHLERVKAIFKNDPKYDYEIVEAEEHLEERINLTGKPTSEPALDIDPKVIEAAKRYVGKDKIVTRKINDSATLDPIIENFGIDGAIAYINAAYDQANANVEADTNRTPQEKQKIIEGNEAQRQKDIENLEGQRPLVVNRMEFDPDFEMRGGRQDRFGQEDFSGESPTTLRDQVGRLVDEGYLPGGEFDSPTPTKIEDRPLILNRNNKPWTLPNPKYLKDQLPDESLVGDARAATHPNFLAEFERNIKENKYSRILLKEFINRVNKKFETNTQTNTEVVYKIEETKDGFVIAQYETPIQPVQSLEALQKVIDRIITNAKDGSVVGKGVRGSRFRIRRVNEKGNPQPISMPYITNNFYRQVMSRLRETPSGLNYKAQLADSVITFIETMLDPEFGYELTFDFEPITEANVDAVFNDAIVYTENNKKEQFTIARLQREGRPEEKEFTELEKQVEQRFRINPRDLTAVRQKVKALEKAAGPIPDPFSLSDLNLLERLLAEGTYNKDTEAGPETTGEKIKKGTKQTEERIEGDPVFKDPTTEQIWDAELEQSKNPLSRYKKPEQRKEPLSDQERAQQAAEEAEFQQARRNLDERKAARKKSTLKEQPASKRTKVKKQPVEPIVSEKVQEYFGQNRFSRALLKQILIASKKHLKLERPLLVFTSTEDIKINYVSPEMKRFNFTAQDLEQAIKEIVLVMKTGDKGFIAGTTLPGKDIDVLVLNTEADPDPATLGNQLLVLAHELGHSLYKQELNRSLTNPVLRKQLEKEFLKDQKANPQIFQYQDPDTDNFQEWFADKVASTLLDLDKGLILKKNKTLSDRFIANIANAIQAFWKATRINIPKEFIDKVVNVRSRKNIELAEDPNLTLLKKLKKPEQALETEPTLVEDEVAESVLNESKIRFTYNETFADYIKNLTATATNSNPNINNISDPQYMLSWTDKARIEETIEQLLDKTFGNPRLEKMLKEINTLAEKIVKTDKLPGFLKKIFYDAHSYTKTLGKDKGTGQKIADFFHIESNVASLGPGVTYQPPGFINASNRLTNEMMQRLVDILEIDESNLNPFEKVKKTVTGVKGATFGKREIEAFKQANDEELSFEQLSPLAQKVRKFLKEDVYDFLNLKEKGVEEKQNFFPRIVLIEEIATNPEKRQALFQLIAAANPEKDGKYINKQIDGMLTNNERDATEVDESNLTNAELQKIRAKEDREKAAEELKELSLGMAAERTELLSKVKSRDLLEAGLIAPPEVAIIEYIRNMARRSEFKRRGGAVRLKQLIDELPKEEQSLAKEAVQAMMGKISPVEHNMWRNISDGVTTVNVFSILGMAVFASLPDGAGPIIRSKQFELSTIIKNITQGLGEREGAQLARDIGTNGVEAAATTILYAGELSSSKPWANKATTEFFRYTQLERWTVFTRKFAAGMARDFLLKQARIIQEGYQGDPEVLLAKRYLADLNLTVNDVIKWDQGGQSLRYGENQEIKEALNRFVDEAIVRPNAAERPIWASDPHWAIVWQLKSFYYAYGKNIVGGMIREGKARRGETDRYSDAIIPLLFGAALILPLTMIGWDLRERFKIGLAYALPGISPNDPGVNYRRSRSVGPGEYSFEVLDRSGLLGAPALALPLFFESKRYGNPAFVPILGPGFEKAWSGISGDFDAFDYVPGYSSLDTRNIGR